tara:strand:- start:861 stop:971 length:111 start_codon:yes stop_codon:yes gene_type:complete
MFQERVNLNNLEDGQVDPKKLDEVIDDFIIRRNHRL